MKTMLFVLLTVLLWGGEARADCNTCEMIGPGAWSCTSMWCPSAEDISAWEREQEKRTLRDGKRVGDVATCLAAMETAMRGIDWWLPQYLPDGSLVLNVLRAPSRTVLEQWEQAKRDCWGNP